MNAFVVILLTLLLANGVLAGGLMFKYGARQGDKESYEWRGFIEEVDVSIPYRFFGNSYDKINVSSYGYVSFGAGVNWTDPYNAEAWVGTKMAAPLWSANYFFDRIHSHVWYQERTEAKWLNKARKIIQKHFGDCGALFVPRSVFVVTWENVTSYCEYLCPWYDYDYLDCVSYFFYYHDYDYDYDDYDYTADVRKRRDVSAESARNKRDSAESPETAKGEWHGANDYQAVFATDGYDTFAIFNLKKMDWSHCFEENKMLFNAGDGVGFYRNYIAWPSSDLLLSSNVKKAGRWVYKISERMIQDPTCANIGT